MSTTLPKPRARTLYLPEQVNQESMNKLTKAIIDVNKSDDYLKKLYGINDIEYVPKPIEIYIDSYGGAVYQCFGLLGVMEKSETPGSHYCDWLRYVLRIYDPYQRPQEVRL